MTAHDWNPVDVKERISTDRSFTAPMVRIGWRCGRCNMFVVDSKAVPGACRELPEDCDVYLVRRILNS